MNMPQNPLTLIEYSEKVGRAISSVRRWIPRSNSKTAVKIGRDWFISADKSYIGGRIKTGKCGNWRNERKGLWKPECRNMRLRPLPSACCLPFKSILRAKKGSRSLRNGSANKLKRRITPKKAAALYSECRRLF